MDAIERNILVRQDHSSFDHISYVQGTNAIPIIFHIKDYTVETGTQARVFVRRADGTIEYDNASISGNDITVNVKSTMFSVVGDSILQINLLKGSKTLVTFGVTVHVKKNHTYTGSQSEDKTDIFDDVLAEARTAIDAANTAAQNIQNKADNGDFTGSVKIGTVTTGSPGSAASATNTGTLKDAVINFTIPRGYPGASMRMTGAWTERKQYVNNTSYIDLASYEGSTYGCIQTHTSSSSILPTNTEYWQIVAKKGETGNIENLDSIPITFEEAAEKENLESGESLPTGLGKIKKWFSDLKQAAFMNVVNGVTQSVAGQAVLDAAVGKYLDEKKFDISRVVANRNITEPGFTMDGKTAVDWFTELTGKLGSSTVLKSYGKSNIFDFNDASIPPGMYRLGGGNSILNPPGNNITYGNVLVIRHPSLDTLSMLAFSYGTKKIYYRTGTTVTFPNNEWDSFILNSDLEDLNSKISFYAVNNTSFASILNGKDKRITYIVFYNPTDNPFSFNAGYAIAFNSLLLHSSKEFCLIGVSNSGTVFETKYLKING